MIQERSLTENRFPQIAGMFPNNTAVIKNRLPIGEAGPGLVEQAAAFLRRQAEAPTFTQEVLSGKGAVAVVDAQDMALLVDVGGDIVTR